MGHLFGDRVLFGHAKYPHCGIDTGLLLVEVVTIINVLQVVPLPFGDAFLLLITYFSEKAYSIEE